MKSYGNESGRAENSNPPDCSVYTQLYPYYYSVCDCPVPSCLYTYCVQCVVDSQALVLTAAKKKKKKSIPLLPYFLFFYLLL